MYIIDSDLKNYISSNILLLYKNYDEGHNENHIIKATENSLEIAKDYNVNLNMVYTIANYHDIGIAKGRKTHHITSAEFLMNDNQIKRWFSKDQLILMKEAIEDHRASTDYEPRSIYGKIISEADRNIDVDTVIYRTMKYGQKNYPHYSFEEQFERLYKHVSDKYGVNGYLRLWLDTPHNTKGLMEIRNLLLNKAGMRSICLKYYCTGTEQ